MALLKRFLPALVLACAACTAMAQPYPQGCHYYRNHPVAPPVPTPADRALIDQVIARSDTFDILHYDINIDVTNYDAAFIQAATTVRYTALMEAQQFIRFELWDLEVDSVTAGGIVLEHSYDGEVLRVDFVAPPVPGEVDSLTVHYHGQPRRDPQWGGFYFESGYIYNLGIGLSTIPPNFGKVWYPCFDSFVERATYTYHVKSANGMKAHGQGAYLGEVQLGGDTVVRSFHMAQPIPTYLSAIAVSNYVDSNYVHSGAFAEIPVRLTATPGKLAGMAQKMVDVGAAIDACEHWYGPYGWGRVGYVLTTDGALEIPTNIAFPDFMPTQTQAQNRRLLTHELGHSWWGDMVTPRTQQDMWLKEGPAEYSAHLVEEWIGGEEAFVNTVKDNQLYVLQRAHMQDGGFQPLSPMPDPYIYGLTTYYKGASVMHNLRGYMGDTLFSQAMHDIQAAHAYQTLDAIGFRDALEASSGLDLGPFFTDQVFAPGFSVFVVQHFAATQASGHWQVQLGLKQKLRGATVFHEQVPLDLTLVGAQGQRQEYRITVGGEYDSAELACGFEPVMAVLNGHNRLNQARMDLERPLLPGVAVPVVQPRVNFRLQTVQVPDTGLLRIEHIWAAPESDQLGTGIAEISGTNYWIVDGYWPDSSVLKARVAYAALDPASLDHELLGVNEAGVMLLYRPNATTAWEVYPDQTVNAGVLVNGSGNIDINVLRKGQYAFGKGIFTQVAEHAGQGGQLQLWPVPTGDVLNIGGLPANVGTLCLRLFGSKGELLREEYRRGPAGVPLQMALHGLPTGNYMLQVRTLEGSLLGRSAFVVAR